MGEQGAQHNRKHHVRHGRKRGKDKGIMDNLLGSPTLADRIALLQRSARNHKGGVNISGTPLILPDVSSSSSSSNEEEDREHSERPRDLPKSWNVSTATKLSGVDSVEWPETDSWARWSPMESRERAASDAYHGITQRETEKEAGSRTRKSRSSGAANDESENDVSAASVNRRLDEILDKLSRLSLPENATDEERQDVDLIRNMASLSFERVVTSAGTGRIAEVNDNSIDRVVHEVMTKVPDVDRRRGIESSSNIPGPGFPIGSNGTDLRDPRDTADLGCIRAVDSTSDKCKTRNTGQMDRAVPQLNSDGQPESNVSTGEESILELLNKVGPNDVMVEPHVPRKRLDPSYPYYGVEGTGRLGIAERVDVFQSQRASHQRHMLDESLSFSSVVDTDEGVGGTPRTANGAAANRTSFWIEQTNGSGLGLSFEKSSSPDSHAGRGLLHAHGLHHPANPAENTLYGMQNKTEDDAHTLREQKPTALLVKDHQILQSKGDEWNSRNLSVHPFAFEMVSTPTEETRPTSSIELDASASSLTGVSQDFLFGWDGTPLNQRRHSLESTASLVEETFRRPGFETEGFVTSQSVERGTAVQLRDNSNSVDFTFLKPESGQSSMSFNGNLLAQASSPQRDGRSKSSLIGFTASVSTASEQSFPMNRQDFVGGQKDFQFIHVPTVLQSSVESHDANTASHRHHITSLPPPSLVSECNVDRNVPLLFAQMQLPYAIRRDGEFNQRLVMPWPPSQERNSYCLDQTPRLSVPTAYTFSSDVGRSPSAQLRFQDEVDMRLLPKEKHHFSNGIQKQSTFPVDSQSFVDPRLDLEAHILRAPESPVVSGLWQGGAVDCGMVNASKVRSTLRPPSLVDESANTSTPSRAWVMSGTGGPTETRTPSRQGVDHSVAWEPFGRGGRKHPQHQFPSVNVEPILDPRGEQVDFPDTQRSERNEVCGGRGNTLTSEVKDRTALDFEDNTGSEKRTKNVHTVPLESHPFRTSSSTGQLRRQYPGIGELNQGIRFSNMTGVPDECNGFSSRVPYIQTGSQRLPACDSAETGDKSFFRQKTAQVERLLDSHKEHKENDGTDTCENVVRTEVLSQPYTSPAFEQFLVIGERGSTPDTSGSDHSDRSSIVSHPYQLSNIWMNRITPRAQARDPPFDLQPANTITIRQQAVKSRTLRDPPNDSSRSSLGRKPKKEPEGRGLERPSSRLMTSMVCTSCSSSTGVVGQEEDFVHHNDSRDDDSDLFENIDDETACNTGHVVDEILGPPLNETPTGFATGTVTRRFRASTPQPQLPLSATLPMITKPRSTLGAEIETVTSSVFAVHDGKRSTHQGRNTTTRAERVPDVIKADSLEDTKETFISSVYAKRPAEKNVMSVPTALLEERREKEKSDQVHSYWRSMSDMKPLGSFDSVANMNDKEKLNVDETPFVGSRSRNPASFKPSTKQGEPKQGIPGEIVNHIGEPPPPPPPPMDRKQHIRVKDRLLHMGPLLSPSSDTLDSLTADSDRESTAHGDSRVKGCNLLSCGDGEWLNGWQLLGFR